MRFAAVISALLVVVSCGKPGAVASYANYSDEKTDVRLLRPPAGQMRAPAPQANARPDAQPNVTPGAPVDAAPGAPPQATPSAALPQLAYSYSVTMETPANQVRPLMARHEAVCTAAGPTICEIIASNIQEAGRDNVSATLSIRATPTWLTRFREGLAGDVDRAHGRVTNAGVSSEDLSRQIIDTDAHLRAKTLLRERLEALLRSHSATVADLLSVEKAASDNQQNIDAAQAELAAMRARIATSELKIEYQSKGVFAPQGAWAPLKASVDNFMQTVAVSLAALVQLVALIFPWFLVGGGLVWLLRRLLAKRRRQKVTRLEPGSPAS